MSRRRRCMGIHLGCSALAGLLRVCVCVRWVCFVCFVVFCFVWPSLPCCFQALIRGGPVLTNNACDVRAAVCVLLVIGSSLGLGRPRVGCLALVLRLWRPSGRPARNILVWRRLSSCCGIHIFSRFCLLVLGVCLFSLSLLRHAQVSSSYTTHLARCFGARKGSLWHSLGQGCS